MSASVRSYGPRHRVAWAASQGVATIVAVVLLVTGTACRDLQPQLEPPRVVPRVEPDNIVAFGAGWTTDLTCSELRRFARTALPHLPEAPPATSGAFCYAEGLPRGGREGGDDDGKIWTAHVLYLPASDDRAGMTYRELFADGGIDIALTLGEPRKKVRRRSDSDATAGGYRSFTVRGENAVVQRSANGRSRAVWWERVGPMPGVKHTVIAALEPHEMEVLARSLIHGTPPDAPDGPR